MKNFIALIVVLTVLLSTQRESLFAQDGATIPPDSLIGTWVVDNLFPSRYGRQLAG
jgi:hypothetical protein